MKWLIILFIWPYFAWGQNNCFTIESILVDACGTPEGPNEMVRIKIGGANLNTTDMDASWANFNNPYLGICQNTQTADNVAYMNSTITSCGHFLEPTNGVLPANSDVLIVTSEAFDPTAHNYAGLKDTIYVIFQCEGNVAGHFANWINNCDPNAGDRTTTISFGGNCSQTVTYNRCFLTNQNGGIGGSPAIRDGARADFDENGTVNYRNDGCTIPIGDFSVNANITAGQLPACKADDISVFAQIVGIYDQPVWSSNFGTFNDVNAISTQYSPNVEHDHYIYFSAVDGCENEKTDSVLVSMEPEPEVSITQDLISSDCEPGSISLSASSNVDFSWSTNETAQEIFPLNEGYVYLTAENNCGKSIDSVFIDFGPDLSVSYEFDQVVCLNDSISFEIDVQGGAGNYELNFSFENQSQVLQGNSFELDFLAETIGNNTLLLASVIDLENPNCIQELNDSLSFETLELPDLNISQMLYEFCQFSDEEIPLNTNNSFSEVELFFMENESQNISSENGTIFLPVNSSQSGVYSIFLDSIVYKEAPYCQNEIFQELTISILEAPTGEIIGDTSICEGADSISYQLISDSGTNSNLFSITENGTNQTMISESGVEEISFSSFNVGVNVIVLNYVESLENGCKNFINDSIFITVEPLPEIDFQVHPTEMIEDFTAPQFMNFSDSENTYWWDYGEEGGGLDTVYNGNHNYTQLDQGEFLVTLYGVSPLGCKNQGEKAIFYNSTNVVYVPNSFTPDGNSYNEEFKPVLNGDFDIYDYELIIFNRWGEVVFESNNSSLGWDGTYNNEFAPEGTYIWKLAIGILEETKKLEKKGHLNLFR